MNNICLLEIIQNEWTGHFSIDPEIVPTLKIAFNNQLSEYFRLLNQVENTRDLSTLDSILIKWEESRGYDEINFPISTLHTIFPILTEQPDPKLARS